MSTATFVDNYPIHVVKIEAKKYPIARIIDKRGIVKISQKLPFYVRFDNVMMEAYGPSYPAPIGIAVIGKNNYIL